MKPRSIRLGQFDSAVFEQPQPSQFVRDCIEGRLNADRQPTVRDLQLLGFSAEHDDELEQMYFEKQFSNGLGLDADYFEGKLNVNIVADRVAYPVNVKNLHQLQVLVEILMNN